MQPNSSCKSFSVHEDSLNPAKYYYEPGFHPVVQNSASILVNKRQIDRADEVSKISAKMTKMATEARYLSADILCDGRCLGFPALEAQNPGSCADQTPSKYSRSLKAEYDRLMSSATTKQKNLLPQTSFTHFRTVSRTYLVCGFSNFA